MSYRHLYVHVPFCARRCSYCDFSIAVRRVVPSESFATALSEELRIRATAGQRIELDTLYFGGGTPSRLGADGVARAINSVKTAVTVAPSAEVTLEANPEDITVDAVKRWRDAGINRLSIGVQSFDDAVLRWMHRVHDASQALRAIEIARDGGLPAFSLDLIFALPAAQQRDWSRDLELALECQPDHISLYGLTIEPHTPLGRWQARGEVLESPEEQYEQEFLEAHHRLAAAGFEHYEVSNFALPGRRAVHNSAYWRGVPYLGIGPSAHGFDGEERRWNLSAYTDWDTAVLAGLNPVGGAEQLTEENRVAEKVYLGLRTRDGLLLSETEAATLSSWFAAEWLEWIGLPEHRLARCTPMGWLRLDRLATDLTALRSHS